MSGAVPADLVEALREAAAHDRVVFATDFDGVLAPLQDDPMAVRPVAGSMELLRRASDLPGVTVAVVSGRDLATLSRLTGVDPAEDGIILIGSHGGQGSRGDLLSHPSLSDDQAARLAALTEGLEHVVARWPGARIELKPAAVVLHTRGAPADEATAATTAAFELAAAHPGTHPLAGKDVVELAVTDVSKGSALRTLVDALDATSLCYFGDDVTDETVFRVLRSATGDVGVKVGAGDTLAGHRVGTEADVVAAFESFVEAREASDRPTAG